MADWRRMMEGRLPGLFGIEPLEVERGHVVLRLDVRPDFLAPNGYLHGGTVVTLADTACGFGPVAALPDRAPGVPTVERKTNLPPPAADPSAVRCAAAPTHRGRPPAARAATL